MVDRVSAEAQALVRSTAGQTAELSARILDNLVTARSTLAPGFHSSELALINGVELILLAEHDLACLLSDLVSHTGTLRGNLYARLAILTIHESTHTLRSVIARPFREQLTLLVGGEHPMADGILRAAHSAIGTIYDKSEAQFGTIRDGIVAHRDRDPDLRVELLRAADEEAVASLAAELLAALLSLLPLIATYSEVFRQRGIPPVA